MQLSKIPNEPLCVDYAYMNGNWKYYTMETHSHGFLELNYIAEGGCVYEIDGKDYPLTAHNLILFDSSLPHKMRFNHDRPCTVLGFSVHFEKTSGASLFPGLLDSCNHSLDLCRMLMNLNKALVFPDGRSLQSPCTKLFHEFEGRRDNFYLTSLCYAILNEAARLPLTEKSSALYYVEKTRDYIKESFYRIANNEQIAAHIGLNATYLERIYKKQTGTTLWESVTACRLSAAKELLSQPGIPIGEIETMIGFANRQTFYLQFKNKFGVSPSEYRKRCLQAEGSD